jgi:hypothetical protein
MSEKAIKGQFVKIHNIILESSQRASTVPEDTKKVPFEMWINGFLVNEEASFGDVIKIKTVVGRSVEGTLVDCHPKYEHTFGKPIPELMEIGPKVRNFIDGGEYDG